jgi:uncharacterized protein (DUF433 family)
VSLNQFILWAVAEKVGTLSHRLDDPAFPHITYRRGASGHLTAVVRGTGIRVQTLVIASQTWGFTPAQLAAEYAFSSPRLRRRWPSTPPTAARLTQRWRQTQRTRPQRMTSPRLPLDADTSIKALHSALVARGHDVTPRYNTDEVCG